MGKNLPEIKSILSYLIICTCILFLSHYNVVICPIRCTVKRTQEKGHRKKGTGKMG